MAAPDVQEHFRSDFGPKLRLGTSNISHNLPSKAGFRPVTTFRPPSTSNRPGTVYRPGSGLRTGTGFRPGTSYKPGTGQRPGTGLRPGTGFRPITGEDIKRPITGYGDGMNRPMTAVRGAGYSSGGRKSTDLLSKTPEEDVSSSDSPLKETQERKFKNMEANIMKLVEESIIANTKNNKKHALALAKEASTKERNLIRMQEQSGMSDNHNMDLTYSVVFNLANQYTANELYTEAIKTFQLITKNRMFPNSNRLKINMGIIYYKLGHFTKSIKMFKMAMDQAPASQKQLRMKIMHNIGVLLVKMAKYEEACINFEYIMTEQPEFRSGLHLLLCYYALRDKDKMKRALAMILDVQLEVDEEDKHMDSQNTKSHKESIHEAIKNDQLSKYENDLKLEAENTILTAAKLIAPIIEDTISAGYDWCIEAIKVSNYSQLAGNLEISKAIMYLKNRDLQQAIETLKGFEKQENKIAGAAATNLSFIYYLQNDLSNAEKYAHIAIESKDYKGYGYINMGCIELSKDNIEKAKEHFIAAAEVEQSSVEAHYNLGLLYMKGNEVDQSLECFNEVNSAVPLTPWVLYQTGLVLTKLKDVDAASEMFNEALGVCPAAPGLLTGLADIQEKLHEPQLAYNYYSEAFRNYPSDFNVINWLGSYFIDLHVAEKALYYFEKAALLQPGEPKWKLMVASCYRQSGNLHKALKVYEEVHKTFPDNEDCLRFLVRLCTDLGLKEASEYAVELRRIEKSKEVRERIGSSRPGTSRPGTAASRRSGSGLSSRGGSGQSGIRQNSPQVMRSSINSNLKQLERVTSFTGEDSESLNSGFSQGVIDVNYTDPLGPMEMRPRTSAGKSFEDDFGDIELGDDLLPE